MTTNFKTPLADAFAGFRERVLVDEDTGMPTDYTEDEIDNFRVAYMCGAMEVLCVTEIIGEGSSDSAPAMLMLGAMLKEIETFKADVLQRAAAARATEGGTNA